MMDNIQFICFKRAMDLAAPKDVMWKRGAKPGISMWLEICS
jgi:hypothetical protein